MPYRPTNEQEAIIAHTTRNTPVASPTTVSCIAANRPGPWVFLLRGSVPIRPGILHANSAPGDLDLTIDHDLEPDQNPRECSEVQYAGPDLS
jgi:hypothetical protein